MLRLTIRLGVPFFVLYSSHVLSSVVLCFVVRYFCIPFCAPSSCCVLRSDICSIFLHPVFSFRFVLDFCDQFWVTFFLCFLFFVAFSFSLRSVYLFCIFLLFLFFLFCILLPRFFDQIGEATKF